MAIGKALVRVPATAARGEVIEIRALVQHPMESGQRRDNMGAAIPRRIIDRFVCTYNGEEVLRAELFPAIAANPYFSFFATADESGSFVFTWTDDDGETATETAAITVT